jgi:hypothetical protein
VLIDERTVLTERIERIAACLSQSGPQRSPCQSSQHLLAGRRRSQQKPVDRTFAGVRTELADHQRFRLP